MRFHLGLGVGHLYGHCSMTSTPVETVGSQDQNQDDVDDIDESNSLGLGEAAGDVQSHEETDSDDSSVLSPESEDSDDHMDDEELLVMADMYGY